MKIQIQSRQDMPRVWVTRASGLALVAGFALSIGACSRTEEPQATAQTEKSEAQGGVTQYDSGTTTTFEPASER